MRVFVFISAGFFRAQLANESKASALPAGQRRFYWLTHRSRKNERQTGSRQSTLTLGHAKARSAQRGLLQFSMLPASTRSPTKGQLYTQRDRAGPRALGGTRPHQRGEFGRLTWAFTGDRRAVLDALQPCKSPRTLSVPFSHGDMTSLARSVCRPEPERTGGT